MEPLPASHSSNVGQLWFAVSASAAAHAVILCGVWWLGAAHRQGPHLVLAVEHGESSAIALSASFANAPSVSDRAQVPESVEFARDVPEPDKADERTAEQLMAGPPQPERPTLSPPVDTELLDPGAIAPKQRPQVDEPPVPSHPQRPPRRTTATATASVASLQDLGAKNPPLPDRKHVPPLVYPREALDARIEGAVEVLVAVNARGRVAKATIYRSSGHEILDRAAIEWVRQWQFQVDPKWFVSRAEIRFRVPVKFDILPPRR